MAKTYKDLLDRRKELMSRLVDVVHELADIDQQLEPLGQAVGLLSGGQAAPDRSVRSAIWAYPAPESGEQVSLRRRGIGGQIGTLVEEILGSFKNRPMTTRELHRELIIRGLEVPGLKPLSNLAAHLTNNSRFERTNHGWVLRKKEEP